jgi:hypothetical protein
MNIQQPQLNLLGSTQFQLEPKSRHRRLILLLGSPRSGTTWLAKILDTSPEVLYLHEPLKLWRPPSWSPPTPQTNCGDVQTGELTFLHGMLSKIDPAWFKPPFFPKQFLSATPRAMSFFWGVQRLLGSCVPLTRRCFTPLPGVPFDLLVKEVDWRSGLQTLTDELRPNHLIVLVRHPCAVVSSRLKGLRLGVMESHRSAWIESYADRCKALGFAPDRVAAMEMYEFFAVRWLVSTTEQLEIARTHAHATTVVYEELCRAPVHTAKLLFSALNWKPTSVTEHFIRCSTSPKSWWTSWYKAMREKKAFYAIHNDPMAASASWRKHLTPTEQRRVLAITAAFPHMDWWAGADQEECSR